jgi:flagellar biosynthesis protein
MKKDKPKAVALRYDGTSAPKVTAKGEGLIAKKIIETAKEHGIPLQKNEELTGLLSKVRLNTEIPRSLYTAVAQILVFLYHVNGTKPKNMPKE